MPRTRYTPEEKAKALELLAEHGQSEASRLTGIPGGTIASWGSRCGVAGPNAEEFAERYATMRMAFAARKAELGDRMGDVAANAVEQLDALVAEGKTRQARELAGALAVLVDKAQLLTGAATTRTEITAPERTPEQEGELARVLEFARRSA